MRRIWYIVMIRRRGWFGVCCTLPKLRCAHVDEDAWRRLKGRPFSLEAMMAGPTSAHRKESFGTVLLTHFPCPE